MESVVNNVPVSFPNHLDFLMKLYYIIPRAIKFIALDMNVDAKRI